MPNFTLSARDDTVCCCLCVSAPREGCWRTTCLAAHDLVHGRPGPGASICVVPELRCDKSPGRVSPAWCQAPSDGAMSPYGWGAGGGPVTVGGRRGEHGCGSYPPTGLLVAAWRAARTTWASIHGASPPPPRPRRLIARRSWPERLGRPAGVKSHAGRRTTRRLSSATCSAFAVRNRLVACALCTFRLGGLRTAFQLHGSAVVGGWPWDVRLDNCAGTPVWLGPARLSRGSTSSPHHEIDTLSVSCTHRQPREPAEPAWPARIPSMA